MGDNKISEAAALAASLRQIADAQYTRRQRFNGRLPADVQEVLRMAADHLQGEAVPVALDRYDTGLLGDGGGGDVNWWWDYVRSELDRAHEFYQDQVSHPQPAELSEVSGGSGELPPLPSPARESVSECGPDYFDASQMRQYARAALAATGKQSGDTGDYVWEVVQGECVAVATGKQQVGEAQGSREQFEAWAESFGYSLEGREFSGYSDEEVHGAWFGWQAAIASRQPVTVNESDYADLPDIFDGRDAGAGDA